MRTTQSQLVATLSRVQAFLGAEPFASNARFTSVRQRLDAVIRALGENAVQQKSAEQEGRGDAARRRSLSYVLQERRMRPIVRAARAILGRGAAEAAEFRMPGTGTSTAELVASAGALAQTAARYAPRFVASGMAPDFLARLQAAADDLHASTVNRGRSVGRRTSATAGLKDVDSEARQLLTLLDVVVKGELADDPERLAEWRSIAHVRKPATRAGEQVKVTGPTPPTAPPTSVAVPPASRSHAA